LSKKSKAELVSDAPCKDPLVDEKRRRFLVGTVCVLGGVGAICAVTPFLAALNPSAKVRAEAGPVEVDLSHLTPGQQITVEWRGKPVWIIRRTPKMLEALQSVNPLLRDPDSLVPQQPSYAKNSYRSINPEYLVLVGLCTHLGCSPKYKPSGAEIGLEDVGGFYCPCHGSRFDLSGRVFKQMPAPINLEVPPYRFIREQVIIIGEGV